MADEITIPDELRPLQGKYASQGAATPSSADIVIPDDVKSLAGKYAPPPPPPPPPPGLISRAATSLADAFSKPDSPPPAPAPGAKPPAPGPIIGGADRGVQGLLSDVAVGKDLAPAAPAPPAGGPLDQPVSLADKKAWGLPDVQQTALELASGMSIRPGHEANVADALRRRGAPVPGDKQLPGASIGPIERNTLDRVARDTGRSFMEGVANLPGTLTGLADIPFALASGDRPITAIADAISKATGFSPEQWAKQSAATEHSSEFYQDQANLTQAWKPFEDVSKQPNATILDYARAFIKSSPTIAMAYAMNPSYALNLIAQNLPQLVLLGGIGGRLASAGKATPEALGYLERLIGKKLAIPVASGIGEGAVQAGQQMQQDSDAPDQQKNAIAALGTGVIDAILSAGTGRLAQHLGLETAETALTQSLSSGKAAMQGVNADAHGLAHRMLGGAVTEGVLQEPTQSAQEQVGQNWVEGKPLGQGVMRQSVEGGIVGAALGAGANAGHSGNPMDSLHAAIDEAGRRSGLGPKATQALREAVVNMTPDMAVPFVERVLNGYEKRGLTKRPGAVTAFQQDLQKRFDDAAALQAEQAAQAQGQPPEAAGAAAAAAPEPDYTGLATTEPTITTPIDEAAHAAATSPMNSIAQPTDGQKEAGNYAKGHIRIGGLDIAIENPQGSTRSGVGADGQPWSTTMAAHYGYVKGTLAGDGDHSDVFIKPGTPEDYNGPVYVIDQVDPQTGKFDEHKSIIGASSDGEARALYQANYSKDWKGLGAITALPMQAYKSWVRDGTKRKPLGVLPEPTNEQQSHVAAATESPSGAPVAGGDQSGGGGRAVGPVPDGAGPVDRSTAAPAASTEENAAPANAGQPDATLSLQEGSVPSAGPRVLGSLGLTPKSAEKIDLRQNTDGTLTPHQGRYPMVDFESGKPIKVAHDATDAQVVEAIKSAGAVPNKHKFYGVKADQAAATTSNAAATAPATAPASRESSGGSEEAKPGATASNAENAPEGAKSQESKPENASASEIRAKRVEGLKALLSCLMK